MRKKGFQFQAAAFTGDNSNIEIIPNALLIHAWTYLTSASSFNGPSWSISIEFYLYVILFITLVINRKARNLIWFTLSSSAFAFIFLDTQPYLKRYSEDYPAFFLAFLFTQFKKIKYYGNSKNQTCAVQFSGNFTYYQHIHFY